MSNIGFVIILTIAGLFAAFNHLASNVPIEIIDRAYFIRIVILIVVAVALVMFALRFLVRGFVRRMISDDLSYSKYKWYDFLAYSSFMLLAFGALGYKSWTVVIFFSLPLFGIIQLLLFALCDTGGKKRVMSSTAWVALLFFLSGFSALIYEICWQRAIYLAFGINIESITIVVSSFMLGLGGVALMGGWLSRALRSGHVKVFLAFEMMIGLYGIVSLSLIYEITALTLNLPYSLTAAISFVMLLPPTLLMGATLPILVEYLNAFYDNVGRSVGTLYAINTAGAAAACFFTVDLFFALMGLSSTVIAAVIVNFLVAALCYMHVRFAPLPDDSSSVGQQ
jgi:hypothetical protein